MYLVEQEKKTVESDPRVAMRRKQGGQLDPGKTEHTCVGSEMRAASVP